MAALLTAVPIFALEVTRFGAVPDDGQDDTAAFLAAFKEAEVKGDKRIVIPKGRYDLRTDGNPARPDALFPIAGVDGLIINGQGAELMMTGKAAIFLFANCQNVTVRGLTVDWARPPFSEGTVIATAPRHFDVKVAEASRASRGTSELVAARWRAAGGRSAVKGLTEFLNRHLVPPLTALSENTYLSAIRAGMVSIVPLTIIGGLFMVESFLPVKGWHKLVAPYLQLPQIPVSATFGLLAVFVCFGIGYDFGKRLKQEAIVSAGMATLVFLMLQLKLEDQSFFMDGLGSKGLFTAILVALVSVRVQKFFTDQNWGIKLPPNVPSIV